MSEKRSCCCGALPALWWWLLTLLGLPLLFWLMVTSRQNPVETDLTARTTEGLKAASLGDVQVNLDHRGRDAQLTGQVASDAEREKALKLVQDTYGIRVVDNAIDVLAPVAANSAMAATEPVTATNANPTPAATTTSDTAPVPASPASFAILPQDGKWVLQGTLSSQAEIDQALAAAEQIYGAGNIVNQLTLGQVAPTSWLASLGGLKSALAGLEQSGLTFANGSFALMGIASSAQAKAAAFEQVRQLLGNNAKLEDQLTVKAPEVVAAAAAAPSFALLPQDGRWVLQGTLSSQAEIDQALLAAEQLYGAGNIVNQLTLGQVAPAAWVSSLGGLKDLLSSIEQAGLKFLNGKFALLGTVSSEQLKAELANKVQQLLGAPVDNQLLVKAPVPSAPVANEVTPPAPVQLNVEQQSCQDKINAVMNGRQVLFETNKAAIKQSSLGLLNNIAKIADDCKAALNDKVIRVGGHTDSVGEDAYNQNLSQQRADAVKDYFNKQGLEQSVAIQAIGYGETQPIASNDTEAGRAQNRRISFDIIQK